MPHKGLCIGGQMEITKLEEVKRVFCDMCGLDITRESRSSRVHNDIAFDICYKTKIANLSCEERLMISIQLESSDAWFCGFGNERLINMMERKR